MRHFLGIDIGTSGARAVVIRQDGRIAASAEEAYPLSTPHPLWSEQHPEHWWRATQAAIRGVLAHLALDQVEALGLTGQMHSLVMLDERGEVLRPAILWNDQRTAAQCAALTRRIGETRVVAETCNPLLTGFTAPKIAWVREHEPGTYARMRRLLLPKDYIRYRLTGAFATDVSDASGTSLLNVPKRAWSRLMLDALELTDEALPEVFESPQVTGHVTQAAAHATGLLAGTPVVAGAGDQAAGAVGAGIVRPGAVCVSLGTSGVVFAFARTPATDARLRTHTFCHAVPDKWHVMGVMLSAGGSFRWWRDVLTPGGGGSVAPGEDDRAWSYAELARAAAKTPAGADGLIFLPYLSGERTPHPDPLARGAFIGLTTRHTRAHMTRAVLEGVAFGLRDSLEILREMGVEAGEIRLTGGGARSQPWRQILADVFQRDVTMLEADEGPAFGAALLASVGAGAFSSVESACETAVRTKASTAPIAAHLARYIPAYQRFRALYPSLCEDFARASEGYGTGPDTGGCA